MSLPEHSSINAPAASRTGSSLAGLSAQVSAGVEQAARAVIDAVEAAAASDDAARARRFAYVQAGDAVRKVSRNALASAWRGLRNSPDSFSTFARERPLSALALAGAAGLAAALLLRRRRRTRG